MTSQFKIPKKKQPAGSGSASLHVSPLSRLQNSSPEFKSYGDQSRRGRVDRMHAGNALGSSPTNQKAPLFRTVVKTLLGLKTPNTGAANHREGWSSQSEAGQRGDSSCFSNGRWRPKRASHRLLPSEGPSPQKKRSDLSEPSGSSTQSISVESVDSLAELRGDGHAGSCSSLTVEEKPWRRGPAEGKQNSSPSWSYQTSEDDFLSPSRNKPSAMSPGKPSNRRRSLDRMALSDLREKERERWRKFRETKMKRTTPSILQLRLKAPRRAPTEPIVLSSEEEEEGEHEGGQKRKEMNQRLAQQASSGGTDEANSSMPSFLQLDFTSLHAGLMHTDANGKMMITENAVTIPLKGVEEGEVTVVASEVRGYGVWDGGVARGGALLAGWKGPAPSLLFLWVSDAQARLLQKELSSIQSSTSGLVCSFLLLVLKEQLQELQAALLASILDMEEYKKGCSSSGGPSSPLEWTDGLLLLHTCPPPLDQHLLGLLGHPTMKPSQEKQKSILNSSGLQLPTRLIQYPVAPSKGRITVAKEDLVCLREGEFLNDVIIDFYLKFLLLEGVGGAVAERSHVFSSFFYKQLSRRRGAGDDDASSVPDHYMRHQRVKTWTRHVNIFTKDFLFVPVNQEAHWFLVVVCFPGLEEAQHQDFHRPAGGKPLSFSGTSQEPPECTELSWRRKTVLKRPCILVMDSLKLPNHENVCRLLRDYLQVEWEVHRGTPRLFTSNSMRSSICRVPQQDNSSDCGLYLLQYAESFLQNPVVHFDLPLQLDSWFPRQRMRHKRNEIRSLIMKMHQSQSEATK